jgi:uncharacterized protein (TIGR00661 family)
MKILYGVPGEGMGHATRSKVVIDHLLKSHDVRIVSSARAYQFLNRHFPGKVHEIKGFHFAFKGARVSKTDTFFLNLKNAAGNVKHNLKKYIDLDNSFSPDLVISDFESFAYYYAKFLKIPVISVDNIQLMDRCDVDVKIPVAQRENARLAKAIVRAKVPGCDRYFISTFIEASIKKKNTELVPPIVRDEIVKCKPTYGDHVVVYQTAAVLPALVEVLRQLKRVKFIVYGSSVNETLDNVELKTFSEDGFIRDFSSAAAVIANGGYSFLSEAIYLKKPVLSVPLRDQFEQYLNALCIEKCGYGRFAEELSLDILKAFMYDLNEFRSNMKAYNQRGNEVLFGALDAYLNDMRL